MYRVQCPTCHERFDVSLTDQAQTVACTFCESKISIPSREAAQREWLAQKQTAAPVVEEYKIAAPENDPAAKRPPKNAAGISANGRNGAGAAADLVLVACTTCHERMRVSAGDKPGKVACTFCGTAVTVPTREAVARWKAQRIRTQPKEIVGEYAAEVPFERAAPRMHLFDRLAEIRTEAPIPPPRWTFFSSVFTFPWHAEVVFRWSAITIGFTFLSLMASFLLSGGVGMGPRGIGIIGMGFFLLPILWVTIFTCSYAADCCLCVIESTSYGHDRIDAWTEGGWKEWMPRLIYLGWIAALPTVASGGVGRLAELAGLPFWPVMLGTLFLLYPIALLSALEANSAWVPLTLPIVKTLYRVSSGWIIFYLLTGAMAAGLVALLAGIPKFGFVVLVPFGPLLATFLLIYARLLGRLGWKIGQVLTA